MQDTDESSQVQLYIQQKAWEWRMQGTQINLQVCPLCNNENYKFYINKFSGLWDCKVCGQTGNLPELRVLVGDRAQGVMSMKDKAQGSPGALPDINVMHAALLNNEDAMEYLTYERGFSEDTIKQMKLGYEAGFDKNWIVYPYFEKGRLVYAKWRSLPPAEKAFRGISGRECPLFNGDVITKEMEELLFVEGEADCVACINQGIAYTVGIPGANSKKAAWVARIDAAKPQKMYLLYDSDKVGQDAAKVMAARIDIAKVYNIFLPAFEIDDGQGGTKPGKDINEWFRAGHTVEEFEQLKRQARPFDVAGVTNLADALQQIADELEGRVLVNPGIDSPWATLNKCMGTVQWGDVVGIIAEGKIGKTTFVLNWIEYLCNQGYTSMLYCLEMPPVRLARKWVSHVAQIPDEEGQLTAVHVRIADEKARSREADILFGYTNSSNPKDEVFDVIRQTVRRYGARVVAFDNLQLLSRSEQHQSQELSILSKKFKQLAMELQIVILLIVQPNRVGENDIVSARNASGTSSIEKDVDSMLALHRKRVGVMKKADFEIMGGVEVPTNFAPEMLCRVDLSRYAAGGATLLWFEGATSTVSELSTAQMAQIPKITVNQTSIPVEGLVEV